MSWWGKLIGSAFGYMVGGPIGVLIGAAIGHNFDKGLVDAMKREAEGQTASASDTERTQSAFFAATFAVMGHIAKSDGKVSQVEINMANNVMAQMKLNNEQREFARSLFNEGKQEGFNLDAVLNQFKQECHHRNELIQMFIEIQIATLLADGVVHVKERKIIHHIGILLGFNQQLIDQLIEMNQAYQQYSFHRGHRTVSKQEELKEAYAVLGVEQTASDEEIKKAYRRLMNQHHPDKLVSKGLPEEMMKLATEKTQDIKKAYEQIKSSRENT